MRTDRTTQLQSCLDRLQQGDEAVREELTEAACERLRVLAHQMLRGDRLRRWEATDDVVQQMLIGLHRALREIHPPTVRAFMALAALHIRRILTNLARQYFRPQRAAANHISNGDTNSGIAWLDTPADDPTPSQAMVEAERWERLHREVERLPEDEREIVELMWFHDLTQEEAAALCGITRRTVQRRWIRARLKLHAALQGELPGS